MSAEGAGNGKVGAVMVVGGGIAGMQSALDLAEAGFKVYLVERSSSIGGRMAQLDKTFPTNDCSMCTISPRLIEVDKHLNIEVLTDTEIESVDGPPGRFTVHAVQHPRYVDLLKCNACGDCVAACPVGLPAEFEQGLSEAKAIGRRYPQAIPSGMVITKTERAPCVLTCPAGINVQGYVALVGAGKFEEAFRLIRESNPLPSICGRVCPHPCETACNRAELDGAVAINPLKRFVTDWVYRKRAETGDPDIGGFPKNEIDPAKPKIAVVGAGPSGLTAAADLALAGHPVTLFERHDEMGGMMRETIPRYRLPSGPLDRDIQDIINLGIEVRLNTQLGRDITVDSLKGDGFGAIYVAVGQPKAASIPVPGSDLDGVVGAVEYLRDINEGRSIELGKRVLVVGGGSVAMDAARTALRLGADDIRVVYRRTRAEMPAASEEIVQAEDEGIAFDFLASPIEFHGDDGKFTSMHCQRMQLGEPDASGRRRPEPIEGDTFTVEADAVLMAIGQEADLSFADGKAPIQTSRKGITVDPVTLATNVEGVFAGGDIATGPRTIVEAIGQGHEAAISILRHLAGQDLAEGRGEPKPESSGVPPREFPRVERVEVAELPPGERRRDMEREVELTLTEEQAIAEGKRCLACGYCSECMECVKVCGPGAIIHDQQPKNMNVQVGAIVMASGYDTFDTSRRDEFGHDRYPNVITSLEFERILSASGPFQGHVVRPSDHTEPKRVAWLQCVGSRDRSLGNDYCSSVCCMYAIKEAVMAVDHVPGLETTIFYNDIRAFGKGFDAYYENAKESGVEFRRGLISTVKQRQQTRNLVLTYVSEDGQVSEEEFDMVVLSVGLCPSAGVSELAGKLGISLNRFGFCQGEVLKPGQTERDGVFVAGAAAGPMDIPEAVMAASGTAALCGQWLAAERHTMVREKTYPEERDVTGEEPRIGVFVCHCGTNIARTVAVERVVQYARTLPNVVFADHNLYTCSTDTQQEIIDTIAEQKLNRVIVSSCTPRTHEPLFQETLREAGLNKYLFEMANIRDQCSWVHADEPDKATFKAEDLVRMAVARARELEPLKEGHFQVQQVGLVLGGGIAGITAALSLGDQGFPCHLVEREAELGGQMRHVRFLPDGTEPQEFLQQQIKRVQNHPLVTVHTGATVVEFGGHVGKFETTIDTGGQTETLSHGTVIMATGGEAYEPTEYGYGADPHVVTQLELEAELADGSERLYAADEVVMIQCVGSREPEHPYCSRVCCTQAVKNALKLKSLHPAMRVTILFRDVRTYGFDELLYQEARDAGVVFIRFDPDRKPEVSLEGDGVGVRVFDDVLQRTILLKPDRLVLSAAIRPREDVDEVSRRFKTPVRADKFFMEAHMKLRPLDFGNEGMFLAGLAHGPKTIAESIAQARGAAARAATVLSKTQLVVPGSVSVVDTDRCAACLTCVRMCPYGVPVINEDNVAEIEAAACQGCGVCAAACPRKAIRLLHYEDRQLLAKVGALFGDEEFEESKGKTF